MSEKLQVKIISSAEPTYWYAGLIGEVFEVYEYSNDYVLAEDKDRGYEAPWRHIYKINAALITAA